MQGRQPLLPVASRGRAHPSGKASPRQGGLLALVVLFLTGLVGCTASSTAAAPPSRLGYERLQQAYSVWQLLDRAREATGRLQTWREVDPETGSSWEHAFPNRTRYRIVRPDGQVYEGYESDETECWRREDGRWDRRPIGLRPPVAAALADDLFNGTIRVIDEGTTLLQGVTVQVVRLSQRAGDRRYSTLARDREVRVWLGVEDALPRRVEIAVPSFQAPEGRSVRELSHFDEPLTFEIPCE
jgi:hypothetical protein